MRRIDFLLVVASGYPLIWNDNTMVDLCSKEEIQVSVWSQREGSSQPCLRETGKKGNRVSIIKQSRCITSFIFIRVSRMFHKRTNLEIFFSLLKSLFLQLARDKWILKDTERWFHRSLINLKATVCSFVYFCSILTLTVTLSQFWVYISQVYNLQLWDINSQHWGKKVCEIIMKK